MTPIDRICKTCQHRRNPALENPCCLCTDHDMWEVAEMVTVSSEKLEALQQENKELREKLEKCANEYATLVWESAKEQQKNKQLREVLGKAKEYAERAKQAITVIDEVMKG